MKWTALGAAAVILVGCNSNSQPDVELKAKAFRKATQSIKTGSEFNRVAEQHEFECHRREVLNSYFKETNSLPQPPDQHLNCIWTEDTSDLFSVVVYGSVQATVYLASDQIIAKEIDTIYTGP